MKSLHRILDWILNVACLAVAVLALVLLAQRFLPTARNSTLDGPRVGSVAKLRGAGWAADRPTLVMAIQTGCHWCEASANFYHDLLRSSSGGAFHPIAVFPTTSSDNRAFLEKLKLGIDDVREADFGELGVRGTPTLILVGSNGQVEASWVGLLSPQLENEVFKRLGVERPSKSLDQPSNEVSPSSDLMTGSQFVGLQASSTLLQVIDVRPRSEFAAGHIMGSLNIPTEELEARAVHEVPRPATVVVYCHYCPPCENQRKSEGNLTYCVSGRLWLQKLGFTDLKILDADLSQLQDLGVNIAGLTREPFTTGSTPVQVAQ